MFYNSFIYRHKYHRYDTSSHIKQEYCINAVISFLLLHLTNCLTGIFGNFKLHEFDKATKLFSKSLLNLLKVVTVHTISHHQGLERILGVLLLPMTNLVTVPLI